MTVKYYVDSNGVYIGALDGDTGSNIDGLTEVPYPPDNASYVWKPSAYVPNLALSKLAKINELKERYALEIQKSVVYTTIGGISKLYQSNFTSQYNLKSTLMGCPIETPVGFFWVSEDNSHVMPFTKADVQNLASTIYMQGWVVFMHFQEKRAMVDASETVSLVDAIIW